MGGGGGGGAAASAQLGELDSLGKGSRGSEEPGGGKRTPQSEEPLGMKLPEEQGSFSGRKQEEMTTETHKGKS